MTPLPCTYWSDPLCIWAFVGQRHLDTICTELQGALVVQQRIVPVFGSIAWRFSDGPWAQGGVHARVQATAEIAARFGCSNVDGRGWVLDCPASSWPAAAAVKAAYALVHGEHVTTAQADAFSWALRCAFFEDNLNIARREVQLHVAEHVGLPRAPLQNMLDSGQAMSLLWEDWNEKERLRVRGSPTWSFEDGREMLYGNVSLDVVRALIAQLRAGIDSGRTNC